MREAIVLVEEADPQHPLIDTELCDGCGDCLLVCPQHGITIVDQKAQLLNDEGCVACGDCEVVCPNGAIGVVFEVVFAETAEEADETGPGESGRNGSGSASPAGTQGSVVE